MSFPGPAEWTYSEVLYLRSVNIPDTVCSTILYHTIVHDVSEEINFKSSFECASFES